ncbi:MAG: PIN domain-containing protein [Pyrinomonadaceae bacterium]
MNLPTERWLIDTNVWIFGLRHDERYPDSVTVLEAIGLFVALVPPQVIKELRLNLTDDEMKAFYRLLKNFPEGAQLSWQEAVAGKVQSYLDRGCRKGDAIIASGAEVLAADLIVTNNRQFLQTINNLPVRILTPSEALLRLPDRS